MPTVPMRPGMRQIERTFGEPIRWWQAQRCACWDPATDTHDQTHFLCGGTGIVKVEQNVSRRKALISQVTMTQDYADIGTLRVGDLVASTWPEEIPLAENDLVIVPSRVELVTA